jgi:hypothetical protein
MTAMSNPSSKDVAEPTISEQRAVLNNPAGAVATIKRQQAEIARLNELVADHEEARRGTAETSVAIRAVPDDPAAKALTELVRLKGIKEAWETFPAGIISSELLHDYEVAEDAYFNDYKKNVDAAWEAARSAVKTGCSDPDDTPPHLRAQGYRSGKSP